MTRIFIATLITAAICGTGQAAAKCSDEIRALQGKAAQTDAANSPGQQAQTKDPQTTGGTDGGGTKSASAKILEAQAHDQRGDEANCMKAVNEAKASSDQK